MSKTKEEIHKTIMLAHDECNEEIYDEWKFGDTGSYECTMKAMQQYADQQTVGLQQEVERLNKQKQKLILALCRIQNTSALSHARDYATNMLDEIKTEKK